VLVGLAVRRVLLLPVQMALTQVLRVGQQLLLQVAVEAPHILALVVTQEAAVAEVAHLDTQVVVQDRVALELLVKEITAAQEFLQQINPLAVVAVRGLRV
jgi:hypothetical protein